MSTVITPFQGTDPFSTATFNNRISQINTGFSYVSNLNLLDNWYFGNPVDQRGGKIIPAGVPYYKNETLIGVTDKAYPYTDCFYIDGESYWTPDENIKRGYTGAGYGIDRWAFSGTSNAPATVIVDSDFVKLLSANSFQQSVENPSRFAGRKLTLSMLIEGVTTGTGQIGFVVDDTWIASVPLPTTTQKTLISVTADIPNDLNTLKAWYYGDSGTEYKIYAVKLELGTTQTLAHQDADGNWVLNEIPDYGEQLRRCQRYFYKVHYVQYQTINMAYEDVAYSFVYIPLPVEMRVKNPALTQSAAIALGSSNKTLVNTEAIGCMAKLSINYSAISNAVRSCYSYCPTADGVTFTLSADL